MESIYYLIKRFLRDQGMFILQKTGVFFVIAHVVQLCDLYFFLYSFISGLNIRKT